MREYRCWWTLWRKIGLMAG